MTITKLSTLAKEFKRLVRPLEVHPSYKVFRTEPCHDGSPHIEEVNGSFNYVVTERGHEFNRVEGLSADDVLYLLLKSATSEAATRYELEVRQEGVDDRSIWFPYQEELMATLRPEWGERLRKEHEAILIRHPFHPRKKGQE